VSGERGSVSIATAGAAAIAMALSLLTADMARVLVASSRAQTAADAAALAAAQELAAPSGTDPSVLAEEYAMRNGASIRSCDCPLGAFEASVVVEVPVGKLLLVPGERSAVAEARAVVQLPSP
jgi:secretion/DNA translocation related TadE-like protein